MVTTIYKSIGPGQDYASFTLAEADLPNIGTSSDLVANDEAIVFQARAGTFNESLTCNSGLTMDATRNVTFEAASGSEHGGDPDSGVILTQANYTVSVQESWIHFEGLVIKATANFYASRAVSTQYGADMQGVQFRRCIIVATDDQQGYGLADYRTSGGATAHGTAEHPMVASNCMFRNIAIHGVSLGSFNTNSINDHWVIANCTFMERVASNASCVAIFDNPGSLSLSIINCLNLGLAGETNQGSWIQTTVDSSGSTNNYGRNSLSLYQFPGKGSPYPITPTTDENPGVGDWAIYKVSTGELIYDIDNDVLEGGVGPETNSSVPTEDIRGAFRAGPTTDPGAWQVSPIILAGGIEAPAADAISTSLIRSASRSPRHVGVVATGRSQLAPPAAPRTRATTALPTTRSAIQQATVTSGGLH